MSEEGENDQLNGAPWLIADQVPKDGSLYPKRLAEVFQGETEPPQQIQKGEKDGE